MGKIKMKFAFELRTQAIYKISELLRFKTTQIDKYKKKSNYKFNFF